MRELRPELEPPEIDLALATELTGIAERLGGASEEEASHLLVQFNDLAGVQLDYADFQGVYGSMDHGDWVKGILATRDLPNGLEREELVELVRRVVSVEGEEWKRTFYVELLNRNTPHPAVLDLIFHPDGDGETTPEAVVDQALSYQTILL